MGAILGVDLHRYVFLSDLTLTEISQPDTPLSDTVRADTIRLPSLT